MIFLIAVGVILLPILFGGLLAWSSAGFSNVVAVTKEEVENIGKGYNTSVTFGHEIKMDANPEEMLKVARLEAARKAASLPRGANMRIGRRGQVNLHSAGTVLDEDPLTAVRIAIHHGWDGAKTGAVEPVAVAAVPAAGVAAPVGKIKLVPGKDYKVIELTDSMPPDEKRKARIANSKAKSAAMKAAKAAGVTAAAPVAAGTPVAAAAPAAQSVNIEPPQFIEMTDGMSPDEKRKARIANSKAKSAFNKALKAAGVNPKEVEIVDGKVVLPGAMPVASAAPASVAAAPAAAASSIPKPDLVEITADMAPDEKRKARIANSKAKSAYNKALKAAGIDPKSMK
ncbi:MAG: hypothetical protein GY805_11480 [Chloroflexi bacterium]|nr:hypothetical protein [Chloroflexota bacterium]